MVSFLKKNGFDIVFILLTFWILYAKAPFKYLVDGKHEMTLFIWILIAIWIGMREVYDMLTDYVTNQSKARIVKYILTISVLIAVSMTALRIF